MKSFLLTYLSIFLFACFAVADIVASPVSDELILAKRAVDSPTQDQIEVAAYLQQLVEASGLTTENITKRDYPDNAALTAAFTALNKSGEGVSLVHALATNSLSQGTTIDTVIAYVKNTGLTKLLSSANQSGLAVSIVMRFFINYSLVPGLWDVIVALWNNGTISLNKRFFLWDIIGGVINTVQQTILSSLITLINAVTDLTAICSSLNKSGLAVSVVDDLLTTSDGKDFVVKLITKGVQQGVFTFGQLIDALKNSGVITDTFSAIIGNSTYRKIIFIWAVKNLVSLIKYIF